MRDNTLFTINSKRASPVEVAYEAIEELPASIQSKPSQVANPLPTAAPQSVDQSGTPREGVISVATFHIGRLELAQQSVGSQACIKLQAASLSGEECPAISWEEFQVIKKNKK